MVISHCASRARVPSARLRGRGIAENCENTCTLSRPHALTQSRTIGNGDFFVPARDGPQLTHGRTDIENGRVCWYLGVYTRLFKPTIG
jgi:hypothetical protein